MFRCMFVDYNTGVAFARGARDLPLTGAWAKTPYISQAYVAGRTQR